VAVGVELTVRDVNLALLLKSRLAPAVENGADPALFVILFYGGASIVAAACVAAVFRYLAEGRTIVDKSAAPPNPSAKPPN
jgi:hypothetical protein